MGRGKRNEPGVNGTSSGTKARIRVQRIAFPPQLFSHTGGMWTEGGREARDEEGRGDAGTPIASRGPVTRNWQRDPDEMDENLCHATGNFDLPRHPDRGPLCRSKTND